MNNKGVLVAVDSNKHRLEELKERARRAGVSNYRAIRANMHDTDSEKVPSELQEFMAKPRACSSMRPAPEPARCARNPEARWRLEQRALELLPNQQDCHRAPRHAPGQVGGRLIYATCSLLPQENEQVSSACCKIPRLHWCPLQKSLVARARIESRTPAAAS